MDMQLACLSDMMGERTEESGMLSVFDMITVLEEEVLCLGPLEDCYASAHGLEWESNLVDVLHEHVEGKSDPSDAWKAKFVGDLKVQLEPLFESHQKLSSSFATLGDKLERQ